MTVQTTITDAGPWPGRDLKTFQILPILLVLTGYFIFSSSHLDPLLDRHPGC